MKKIKKFLSTGLVVALIASLMSGCGSNNSHDNKEIGSSNLSENDKSGSAIDSISSNDGKGRYVEHEYGFFPGTEECEYTELRSMEQLSDGTIRAWILEYPGGLKLMDSMDGGASWQESTTDISAVQALNAETTEDGAYCLVECNAMDSDGNTVLLHTQGSDREENETYISDRTYTWYYFSNDGELKKLSIELPDVPNTIHRENRMNYTESTDETGSDGVVVHNDDEDSKDAVTGDITMLKLADANTLYVYMDSGQLYRVSLSDGQVSPVAENSDYIAGFYICGDRLLVFTGENAYEYDAITGEKKAEHKSLLELWQQKSGNWIAANTLSADGDIYYVCDQGIFAYNLTDETEKQIVDGHMSSLMSTQSSINGFISKADGEFLVQLDDYSGIELKQVMLNYAYDSEALAKPDKQLIIYSLMDDYDVRDAAAAFQKQHPDIYVTVESGMIGDNAITESDAIRTLNTEVMAGDGPDILFMEDLPIDAYIEKGMLADISDLVDSAIQEGKLFENIAGAYRTSDGELYAMPVSFAVPVVIGRQSDINQVSSVGDLANYVSQNQDKEIIGLNEMFSISASLAITNVPAWFNENGTLNEENLKSYVNDMKKIIDSTYHSLSDEEKAYYEESKKYITEDTNTFYVERATKGMTNPEGNIRSLCFGKISGAYDIVDVLSLKKTDSDMTYQAMPGAQTNVYMPSNVFGMSSQSKNTEEAKAFIEFMLDDGQGIFSNGSFPINLDSFEKAFKNPHPDDDGYWPDESEIDAFKDFIYTLTTPAYSDNKILTTVMNNCNQAIYGDVSADDAVEKTVKELNIYLAE